MRINKNIYSLNIFKNYTKNVKNNATALERISSGKKVNSSKDNPIKIERSENINIKIRALQKANENLQDGISCIQIVDSSMGEISNALIRMRELSVEAANDSYTKEDKESIALEIDHLSKFIDETVENTNINGNKLLGDDKVVDNTKPILKKLQIGSEVGETMDIPYYNLKCKNLNIENINVIDNPSGAISSLEKALSEVTECRSLYGSIYNRMEESINIVLSNGNTYENSYSEMIDADIALEMLEFSRTSILMESSISLMNQSNNFPKEILNILSGLIK